MVQKTLLLIIMLSTVCCGQQKAGWDALDLASTELPGATLYYEVPLRDDVGAFRTAYEQYRIDQAEYTNRAQELLNKRDDILTEINRIVGSSPNNTELTNQREIFTAFMKRAGQLGNETKELRFYLVKKATIKEFLQRGGSLPNFTYDKATGGVEYAPKMFDSNPNKDLELALPLNGSEASEKEIGVFFSVLSETNVWGSIVFHEVVELAIFSRLRPKDPYFRWFSDGFANAIAIRLIREHCGVKAAQHFAASSDTKQFVDLEKHVNLYYWMGLGYCIKTPLDTEKRLTLARYAYATLEASRLIERHGLDCVRRILDKVDTGHRNNSRNLFPAVLEVTGEDLENRFKQYQLYLTKEEMLKHYSEQNNAALDRKDYDEVLPALLRMLELRGLEDPRYYSNAAWILFRMGYEAMGDQAILEHADFCKRRGYADMYIVMHKLFLDYSLKCEKWEKAVPSAREIMKVEADYVPALVIEMFRAGKGGHPEEARTIAKHVLELEKNPENPWHQLAQKGLRIGGTE